LAQSNQVKYIDDLEITNTFIASPSLFRNMINLTKLSIDPYWEGGCWPIDMTEYLDAFPPHLYDFSIICTDIEISKLPSKPGCIEKLSIDCGTLSEELVNIISGFFPELYDLTLRGGVKENMTMDLSCKYLENLSIGTYYEQEPHGFSIDSTDGSPVKYYVGDKNKSWFSQEGNLNTVTPEEVQDKVTIELKYNAKKVEVSSIER
jgi:hypothetical protein